MPHRTLKKEKRNYKLYLSSCYTLNIYIYYSVKGKMGPPDWDYIACPARDLNPCPLTFKQPISWFTDPSQGSLHIYMSLSLCVKKHSEFFNASLIFFKLKFKYYKHFVHLFYSWTIFSFCYFALAFKWTLMCYIFLKNYLSYDLYIWNIDRV